MVVRVGGLRVEGLRVRVGTMVVTTEENLPQQHRHHRSHWTERRGGTGDRRLG